MSNLASKDVFVYASFLKFTLMSKLGGWPCKFTSFVMFYLSKDAYLCLTKKGSEKGKMASALMAKIDVHTAHLCLIYS